MDALCALAALAVVALDAGALTPSPAMQLSLILPSVARLDLTDDERAELVRALRGLVDGDRFPLSARVRRLKAILDKLEPPKTATSTPLPAPKPPAEPPRYVLRRKR